MSKVLFLSRSKSALRHSNDIGMATLHLLRLTRHTRATQEDFASQSSVETGSVHFECKVRLKKTVVV